MTVKRRLRALTGQPGGECPICPAHITGDGDDWYGEHILGAEVEPPPCPHGLQRIWFHIKRDPTWRTGTAT